MRGDQKAVLCHCVEQPGRLERDGLAAGVGAGDDKGIVFVAERNVYRHDLFPVNERVAGFFERKAAGIADCGHKGVLLHRQARFGQQQVDGEHCVIAVAELRFKRADLRRESRQDAGDLLLLLCAQLHDAGVGFDNRGRFDKDRCAGGGYVMDDAADLAAVLGAHRHNIAAVAQRNDCVLQEFIGGGILDDIVEFGADGILGRADTAAQIAQRDAGGVRHFLR